MPKPWETLGEIVDDIRQRRRKGAAISDIVRHLGQLDLGPGEISNYLNEAFCLRGSAPSLELLPGGDEGSPQPEAVDRWYTRPVDQARQLWQSSGPYPDLMRRRDRHVFRAVARRTGNTIIVRAASRIGARYIGREGFRPCPVHLWGVPRKRLPHTGLIAADPNEPALCELLASAKPPKSYPQYLEELKQLGFRVGGPEEGYVIRDGNNHAFYPGYSLHGVYNEHGVNAWTGRDGERLRAKLNRRLGEDLVQQGPHDVWDQRLGDHIPAPLSRPLPPVLLFLPDGNVSVRFNGKAMASHYEFLNIAWDLLYPEETTVAQEEAP